MSFFTSSEYSSPTLHHPPLIPLNPVPLLPPFLGSPLHPFPLLLPPPATAPFSSFPSNICASSYVPFPSPSSTQSQEHGGSSNAFTAAEHTNYYFDVSPEALEPTLERFSQFFLSPLFTPSATSREVNAVNSGELSLLFLCQFSLRSSLVCISPSVFVCL